MREADGYTGFDLRVAATTDEDLSGYDSLGGDADPVFVISLAGEEVTRTDDVVPLNDTFVALALPNDTLVQHSGTKVTLNVSVWDEDVTSEDYIASIERNITISAAIATSTPTATPTRSPIPTQTATPTSTEGDADTSADADTDTEPETEVAESDGNAAMQSEWTVTVLGERSYIHVPRPHGRPRRHNHAVHRSGSDTDDEVYWGSGRALWNNNGGDTIIVTTDDGETVIRHEY
jgi:competence protein ComEC